MMLQINYSMTDIDAQKISNMEAAIVCAGVKAAWFEGDDETPEGWEPLTFCVSEDEMDPNSEDSPVWVQMLPPQTLSELAGAIYEHSGARKRPFRGESGGPSEPGPSGKPVPH